MKSMDFLTGFVQHYNHEKYWTMRKYVVSQNGSRLKKMWYLFRIKRMDAYNGASMGTHAGYGAVFMTPPHFPHGIRGVFVSHNAVIGKNACIFHQVTIGEGKDGAPIIGDNVVIGAGAKIIGNINIGNNVRIGANCCVFTDIPDDCTVVLPQPRIINKR